MDPRKYRKLFVSEAHENLARIGAALLGLEKRPDDSELIDEIFREAHSIKGMAASLELEPIAALAHRIEELMDLFRRGGGAVDAPAVDVLLAGVDALRSMVETGGGAPAEPPAEYNEILGRIDACLSAKTASPPPPPEHGPAAPGPRSAEGASRVLEVTVRVSPDFPAPALKAFLVHRKLSELGEIRELSPSLEEIKAGRIEGGRLRLFLATDGPAEEAARVLEAISELVERRVSVIREEGENGRPAADENGRPPRRHMTPPMPKSVRVETRTLDYFVNLIGELTVVRSQLVSEARRYEAEGLKEGLARLGGLVRDLYAEVMNLRVMPLSNVTDMFPRTVRDLARRAGKEVSLLMTGQEIGIDRAVLEDLVDPLVHILRNCVDHGVEAPEEREAAGKPRQGAVELHAYREKDNVVLVVQDDGRGMDPEAIRRRAVEKGLIADDQTARMSRDDLLNLICLPGFSTKEGVTDISGRGVGMDAVRSAVDAVGGKIAIESRPGAGSAFTLTLPRSLAIAQILLVEVRGRAYAVPISKVQHTLLVPEEEISYTNRRPMFKYESAPTPMLELADLLRLPGEAPERRGPRNLFISQVRGNTVGIVVDDFLGQTDGFIKPLGRPLERIPALAGATILGDGRPVFVLDTFNLG